MIWHWSDLKRLLHKALDYTSTAVIVWPVVYPADMMPPKDPHVTIMYLGDITNASFTRYDVIEAIKETDYNVFAWAKPAGVEQFGPNGEVTVLRLDNTYLYRYHDFITSALNKRGIYSASEFPEYKPHVTLSENAVANGVIPTGPMLLLPVQLWWGGEHIKIWDYELPIKVSL